MTTTVSPDLLTALQKAEELLMHINAEVTNMRTRQDLILSLLMVSPVYEASVFGKKVVIRPQRSYV